MREDLLGSLVDPSGGGPLTLEARGRGSAGIASGILKAEAGHTYPIRDGIPRFVTDAETPQGQTGRSFGYKWKRTDTYLSPAMKAMGQRWLIERYGFDSIDAMRDHLERSPSMLDLGCGGGYTASLWMDGPWRGGRWIGVDLSEAIDVAQARLGGAGAMGFVQADALHLPFRPGSFATVFAEGVLHHTPSTRAALKAAVEVLMPGGEILFYVYRRKGPIREYVDDHVRSRISSLPPEEAWTRLEPLTRLGKVLAEAGVTIEVPEDIDLLEIRAGTYDLQRFFYWNVAKVFWNPDLPFDENQHINFDWYHPAFANRQTEEEVRAWCAEFGLKITRFDAQDSGYTVRALRGPDGSGAPG